MPNGPVTREEFNALVHRIDLIDERGTSAASGAMIRLETITNDLAALRETLVADAKRRSENRRWVFGTVLAVATTVSVVVSMLFSVFVR